MNRISCFDNVTVNETGVTIIENGIETCIRFNECARNYAKEKSIKDSKCVALRDIMKCEYVFYTSPKTVLIFRGGFLKYLKCGKTATDKFMELQKEIENYGYVSYDLS